MKLADRIQAFLSGETDEYIPEQLLAEALAELRSRETIHSIPGIIRVGSGSMTGPRT